LFENDVKCTGEEIEHFIAVRVHLP